MGDLEKSEGRKEKSEEYKKKKPLARLFFLEAPPGIGPGIKVLQTSALPLGYGAVFSSEWGRGVPFGNLPLSVYPKITVKRRRRKAVIFE